MQKKNAAVSYVPLIGWFFILFFGEPDRDSRFHGRQGLGALLFLLAGFAAVWVVSRGVIDYLLLFWLEDLLYAAVFAGYLFLLGRGFLSAGKNQQQPLPVIGNWASRIPV